MQPIINSYFPSGISRETLCSRKRENKVQAFIVNRETREVNRLSAIVTQRQPIKHVKKNLDWLHSRKGKSGEFIRYTNSFSRHIVTLNYVQTLFFHPFSTWCDPAIEPVATTLFCITIYERDASRSQSCDSWRLHKIDSRVLD